LQGRYVAIAVPARNEAERLETCLHRLAGLTLDSRVGALAIIVLANNCEDDTAARARAIAARERRPILVSSVDLPPARANAGWARRLALDSAAATLRQPADVLMSTDADTLPARDWIVRTLDHLDDGWDAVAGLARLDPKELRALPREHRLRFAQIRRYQATLDRLKAAMDPSEPWPRHFYEGGASIALTQAMYRRIGGAPTPSVGEDRALFEAVRRAGGRVRHPLGVRVTTSARLVGRAPGGASDTLARWGEQPAAAPIDGLEVIPASRPKTDSLSFENLPYETRRARALARLLRRPPPFAEAV
jgi:cellulose synthase/poly-beta-1,6-N-acetylglucosamine synthase-like glycosyltransferase